MWSKLAAPRAALLGVALVLGAACSRPPERLELEGRTVSVFNDSGGLWQSIEIWVNDHYRVTRSRMAGGERFVVPLDAFVAGQGQRFPADQRVRGIEVTAVTDSGEPVTITWGEGRRR